MNYSVIILCAGRGSRTGLKYNKIFHLLEGKTVYQRSLELFLNDQRCKQIIVVTKKKEQADLEKLVQSSKIEYVYGGQERQDSVYNGLQKVNQDHVFIHDGARPYLTLECIENLLIALKDYRAALLMVPYKDTIKEVKEGVVVKTLKRDLLMQAQTPQVFVTKYIKDAYQKAKDEGYMATDDAQLFEKYENGDIKAVMGDYHNIKITTKEDL